MSAVGGRSGEKRVTLPGLLLTQNPSHSCDLATRPFRRTEPTLRILHFRLAITAEGLGLHKKGRRRRTGPVSPRGAPEIPHDQGSIPVGCWTTKKKLEEGRTDVARLVCRCKRREGEAFVFCLGARRRRDFPLMIPGWNLEGDEFPVPVHYLDEGELAPACVSHDAYSLDGVEAGYPALGWVLPTCRRGRQRLGKSKRMETENIPFPNATDPLSLCVDLCGAVGL